MRRSITNRLHRTPGSHLGWQSDTIGPASVIRAVSRPPMNPPWKIRALAIALIAFFGFGALVAARAVFTAGMSPLLLFSVATNLGFVAGGIGPLTLKPWSWWLTIGLCAIGIT